MKLLIGIMAMLLPVLSGAQASNIKPLTIGDTMPDVVFNHFINYRYPQARLSDFKNKLVILDFWATWCSSCIAGFAHADSLQQQFNNDIQIILVNSKATRDTKEKIEAFFTKRTTITGLKNTLPVITGDTFLDKYFPHTFIPHYVWINKAGRFVGTTSSLELTGYNIRKALAGNDFTVHQKKDVRFDRKMPLLWNVNDIPVDNLVYCSIITGYREGYYGSGRRTNNEGLTIGMHFFNLNLYDLYKIAFESAALPFMNNRVIVETLKPVLFKQSFYDDTLKYTHTYCYDITVPPSTEAEIYRYMQEDLERVFKVTAVTEKRSVRCIVLTASSKKKIAYAKSGETRELDLEKETLHKYIHNYPVADAVQLLNSHSAMPILNETKCTANINIELPFNLQDSHALLTSFIQTGFDAKEELRLIDVIVLKDVIPTENKSATFTH